MREGVDDCTRNVDIARRRCGLRYFVEYASDFLHREGLPAFGALKLQPGKGSRSVGGRQRSQQWQFQPRRVDGPNDVDVQGPACRRLGQCRRRHSQSSHYNRPGKFAFDAMPWLLKQAAYAFSRTFERRRGKAVSIDQARN
jgi:hypothetical protein